MENNPIPQFSSEPKSLGAALWFRIRAAFSEVKIQRNPRRLKLCETLSLGEKRILAVVEFENRRFLVAATSQNISLLQALGDPREDDSKTGL